jgi:hypothetical protein
MFWKEFDARLDFRHLVRTIADYSNRTDRMMLLGTWVPDDAANPHAEICHAFVYRWLIGRGRMLASPNSDPMNGPFNGAVMGPIL